jgi:hypothetical protein
MVEGNLAQIVQKPAYEKFLLIVKGNTLDPCKAFSDNADTQRMGPEFFG